MIVCVCVCGWQKHCSVTSSHTPLLTHADRGPSTTSSPILSLSRRRIWICPTTFQAPTATSAPLSLTSLRRSTTVGLVHREFTNRRAERCSELHNAQISTPATSISPPLTSPLTLLKPEVAPASPRGLASCKSPLNPGTGLTLGSTCRPPLTRLLTPTSTTVCGS